MDVESIRVSVVDVVVDESTVTESGVVVVVIVAVNET